MTEGARPRAGDPSPPACTETILVVEDEPQVRALVRVVLTRAGYTVLEASNGREALGVAAAHQGRIDLILSDAIMPEMNGPDMVAKLRETHPEIPVIYMSGYSGSALSRAIVDTADDYLQKPVSPVTLTVRVRAVLDGHSTRGTKE
jgi:two-component system, cell cycle sensor histidine kinase and response regulator CckA